MSKIAIFCLNTAKQLNWFTMKLFYRRLGKGQPMIILHGMLEMSDFWLPIAKHFSQNYDVIVPDLRNHGKSPHSPTHTYQLAEQDLVELIDDLKLENIILVGYSMGGRISMLYSQEENNKLDKMVIIDVSPRAYRTDEYLNILTLYNDLKKLDKADLSQFKTRKELEQFLRQNIESKGLVNLLQKNLVRDKNGFHWRFNIKALLNYMETPSQAYITLTKAVDIPTLLIHGEKSNFVQDKDLEIFRKFYKNFKYVEIKNTSHLLPYENPEALIKNIEEFVKSS